METSILTGAIIGAITGVAVMLITYFLKQQRFNAVRKSIADPGVEYAALFHYAADKRYKKAFKFYDSYGTFYVIGKTAYYKAKPSDEPLVFNLVNCTVQQEADWRKLKWFSVTTHVGEKFYFNSHKLGMLVNNSNETLKALQVLKSKQAA